MSGSRSSLSKAILVCGLGRFGAATAQELTRLGHDVLAIDLSARKVQEFSSQLARVVEADSTSPEALSALGIHNFEHAIVGIGGSVEASVLTCASLVDLGVKQIWAKAISAAHAQILERIGVHHVIRPEAEAGRRTSHLVAENLLDFIEFDDGFAIVKMRPPLETQGFTLAETQVRSKYGVTIVGIKTPGQDFVHAVPESRISSHDTLIVSGKTTLLVRFAARP